MPKISNSLKESSRRTCKEKRRFSTLGDARDWAKRINEVNQLKGKDKKFHGYFCYGCGAFHTGSVN